MTASTLKYNHIVMDDMDEDFIPARRSTRRIYNSRWLRPIPHPDNKHRITKSPPRQSQATKVSSQVKDLLLRTKKQEKKGSLFLTLLTRDCRFQIFDIIIGQETTIKMAPGLQSNGLLKSLSQASSRLSTEIKEWSQKRPDLVRSQTFGLYNPLVTSFNFSFIATEIIEQEISTSKVYRIYHPTAAVKYSDRLELWQRAMNRLDDNNDPLKSESVQITVKALWDSDYENGGLHWFRNPARSFDYVDIKVDQHKKDGVRDVLVLDRIKYGSLEEAKRRMAFWRNSLGWEKEEQAFVWTEDWEGFFEHHRVVECED